MVYGGNAVVGNLGERRRGHESIDENPLMLMASAVRLSSLLSCLACRLS